MNLTIVSCTYESFFFICVIVHNANKKWLGKSNVLSLANKISGLTVN